MPPPPRRTLKRKVNPLHAKRVVDVDWKDITLLRTFISDRGKIRARRVTGLTPQQQRQVAVAIRNAREMALLPWPERAAADIGAPPRGGPVSMPLAGLCSIISARQERSGRAVPPHSSVGRASPW